MALCELGKELLTWCLTLVSVNFEPKVRSSPFKVIFHFQLISSLHKFFKSRSSYHKCLCSAQFAFSIATQASWENTAFIKLHELVITQGEAVLKSLKATAALPKGQPHQGSAELELGSVGYNSTSVMRKKCHVVIHPIFITQGFLPKMKCKMKSPKVILIITGKLSLFVWCY